MVNFYRILKFKNTFNSEKCVNSVRYRKYLDFKQYDYNFVDQHILKQYCYCAYFLHVNVAVAYSPSAPVAEDTI